MSKIVNFLILVNLLAPVSRSTSFMFASPLTANSKAGLCQIVPRLDKYLHKRVEFSADLHSAWPHGVFLEDPGCSVKTIRIKYETQSKNPSVSAFEKFVTLNASRIGLIASGRFRGIVEKDPASGRPYLSLQSVVQLSPRTEDKGEGQVMKPIQMEDPK